MIRPLRKRDSNGKLYERPAEIETAIDIAIQQDLERQKERGAVLDKKSPEFLRSECLVYLIRRARREGNDESVNGLLTILLRRCAVNLKGKIPDGSRPNAQDIREEILSRFSELFAEDGEVDHVDELDFYECRFNRAFQTLRFDVFRRAVKSAKQLEPIEKRSAAGEDDGDEEFAPRNSEEFRNNPAQIPRLYLKELLKCLPEDERRAVLLCDVMGYKKESDDPLERTAASICKVSGRTIRNRLTRAYTKLSKLKSEKEV